MNKLKILTEWQILGGHVQKSKNFEVDFIRSYYNLNTADNESRNFRRIGAEKQEIWKLKFRSVKKTRFADENQSFDRYANE